MMIYIITWGTFAHYGEVSIPLTSALLGHHSTFNVLWWPSTFHLTLMKRASAIKMTALLKIIVCAALNLQRALWRVIQANWIYSISSLPQSLHYMYPSVNVLLIASLSMSISRTTDADISNCFSETFSVNVVFIGIFHIELKDCVYLSFNVPDGECVYLLFFFKLVPESCGTQQQQQQKKLRAKVCCYCWWWCSSK